jgi:hypothetical protein
MEACVEKHKFTNSSPQESEEKPCQDCRVVDCAPVEPCKEGYKTIRTGCCSQRCEEPTETPTSSPISNPCAGITDEDKCEGISSSRCLWIIEKPGQKGTCQQCLVKCANPNWVTFSSSCVIEFENKNSPNSSATGRVSQREQVLQGTGCQRRLLLCRMSLCDAGGARTGLRRLWRGRQGEVCRHRLQLLCAQREGAVPRLPHCEMRDKAVQQAVVVAPDCVLRQRVCCAEIAHVARDQVERRSRHGHCRNSGCVGEAWRCQSARGALDRQRTVHGRGSVGQSRSERSGAQNERRGEPLGRRLQCRGSDRCRSGFARRIDRSLEHCLRRCVALVDSINNEIFAAPTISSSHCFLNLVLLLCIYKI